MGVTTHQRFDVARPSWLEQPFGRQWYDWIVPGFALVLVPPISDAPSFRLVDAGKRATLEVSCENRSPLSCIEEIARLHCGDGNYVLQEPELIANAEKIARTFRCKLKQQPRTNADLISA
jgi:hypothetical protein